MSDGKLSPYDGIGMLASWNLRDPFYLGPSTTRNTGDLLNVFAPHPKPARKDPTPRQIEWCRANIPAFMPRVINAPR